jgi:hypothetical protein
MQLSRRLGEVRGAVAETGTTFNRSIAGLGLGYRVGQPMAA